MTMLILKLFLFVTLLILNHYDILKNKPRSFKEGSKKFKGTPEESTRTLHSRVLPEMMYYIIIKKSSRGFVKRCFVKRSHKEKSSRVVVIRIYQESSRTVVERSNHKLLS